MTRVLALWTLAACVDVPVPDSEIDCPAQTSTHPRGAALQTVIDEAVSQGVPGVAVAVQTPDGIWQGAAGFADLEGGVAMTRCHVHPWASVGKTWHAALALRLVQAGTLSLDDPVTQHLPTELTRRLANAEQITVGQLLQHASGLRDFNEDFGYLGREFDDPDGTDAPERLLDFVRGDRAMHPPGEGYHYSDTGYVLLALLLHEVTGDLVAAMQTEVLTPLDLEHTELPRGGPDPEGRVNSYWELPGARLENVSELQASYDVQIWGAGNLRSTPADSLRFVGALARGELLGDATQAALTEWNPASERDTPLQYAYGRGVQRRIVEIDGEDVTFVGHYGGDIGASAVILAAPDRPVGLAAGVNLGGFLGGPLNEHVGDAFIDELLQLASD
ncbi:MAG: beta-lactamase family protein [Myxococcales bacterium]|nr:beta-lactamase family protein [Myxococcales bacterium]